jgi:predicted RNA binding protein YcfA (HicA-like mRNA interferase family)
MKPLSGKAFTKVLENKGWQLLRTRGSHHIYGKADTVVRLSVPVHANRPLKVGLLRHLMNMADLSENDFE